MYLCSLGLIVSLPACATVEEEELNTANCEQVDTANLSRAELQEWQEVLALYGQDGQCPTLEDFLEWQDNNQDLQRLREDLGMIEENLQDGNILRPQAQPTLRQEGRTRVPQPRLPEPRQPEPPQPEPPQPEPRQPRADNKQPYDPAPPTRQIEMQPHRKIYRNSESFKGLGTDGRITPGGKYYTNEGSCSFGWTVASKSAPDRIFNLTAGHCGKKGQKVLVAKSGDQPVEIGVFVESFFDTSFRKSDYALIEIYPEFHSYIEASPEVSVNSQPLKLAGWKTADWVKAKQPYICNLGWRSGLSCGSFRDVLNPYTISYDGIIDHGDSGGVIWAQDPADPTGRTIYAIAVTSFLTETDATNAGGKLLAPIMEHYDFTIYN